MCYKYIIETLFDWFYRIITTQKTHGSDFVIYISELGTKLIDEKREEEKVNVYEIQFQSIYRDTNSKEIALTAYKREEIT